MGQIQIAEVGWGPGEERRISKLTRREVKRDKSTEVVKGQREECPIGRLEDVTERQVKKRLVCAEGKEKSVKPPSVEFIALESEEAQTAVASQIVSEDMRLEVIEGGVADGKGLQLIRLVEEIEDPDEVGVVNGATHQREVIQFSQSDSVFKHSEEILLS